MAKKATLGTKIALGFGSLMLIALILGAMGFYEAAESGRTILELSTDRLPAVESLLALKEAVPTIKCAQRTLMDPTIKPDVRKRQYDFFQKAQANYSDAAKAFESVSKTPAEEATWREFVAAWADWQATNAEFVRQVKSIEALELGDPMELLARLNRFRADHYLAETRVQGMLASHKTHQGGEDPKACTFGEWLAGFAAKNPEFAAIVKDAATWHETFHSHVAPIKSAVAAGQYDQAHRLFEGQMLPAAQQVFTRFDAIEKFIQTAQAMLDKARQQAMVVSRDKQLKAADLLDSLVSLDHKATRASTESAQGQATLSKTVAVTVTGLGILVGIGLAVFLTRSITRPVHEIIVGLTSGADQAAAAANEVSAASQSLAQGASEQAAAIEETTANVEEMSSMTRQNAGNAGDWSLAVILWGA